MIRDDDIAVHSQINPVLKQSELNNQGNMDNCSIEKEAIESSDCFDSENDCEFTNSEFYGTTQLIVNSQILL
jgi:hypothetical protein